MELSPDCGLELLRIREDRARGSLDVEKRKRIALKLEEDSTLARHEVDEILRVLGVSR